MTLQEQRAYVEARWDHIDTHKDEHGRFYFFTSNDLYMAFFANSLRELYRLGYEFTVAREEEIRELGEEVEQMADHAHMALERVCDLIDDGEDGESLVAYVRDVCEYTRTWVRLSAILEEKRKGWKL